MLSASAQSSGSQQESSSMIRDDLIQEFGPNLLNAPDTLARLESLARTYDTSAHTLSTKWETYMVNAKTDGIEIRDTTVPSEKYLEYLQTSLRKEHEQKVNERIGLGSKQGASFLMRRDVLSSDNLVFDSDSLGDFLNQSGMPITTTGGRLKARVRGQNAPSMASPSSAGNDFMMSQSTPKSTKTAGAAPYSASKTPPGRRTPTGGPSPSARLTPTPTNSAAITTAKFADRPNVGKLEEVLNEQVPLVLGSTLAKESTDGTTPASFCKISLPPGQQMQGYRYMFDKLTEKGDLIDDRIEEMSKIIEAHIKAEKAEERKQKVEKGELKKDDEDEEEEVVLQHPGIPHQAPFFTAGRICCDSPVEGSRLNEESVILESSRSLGNGARVKLSFADLIAKGQGYALFPGQIVGIEGVNPSGRLLKVSRIITPPQLAPATTTASTLVNLYTVSDTLQPRPINLLVAAGPYTMDNNFDYEPLEALVSVVQQEKPDVVILCGPFVDEAHPLAKQQGLVTYTPDESFRIQIVPRLRKMLDAREGLKVILVPSTKGMESDWVAYPQPPIASGLDPAEEREMKALYGLDSNGLGDAGRASRVLLVPNPVQLLINEVVVTVSTADTLLHIGSEECAKIPKGSAIAAVDRMSRLFRHVLNQRHLYPLSPPSPADFFALDTTRAYSGSVRLQATPDILVITSAQRQMARQVEGCICLNPGALVRRKGETGTFGRVCVHPLDVEGVREKMLFDREEREGRRAMEVDGEEGGRCDEEEEEEEGLETSVALRCRVEITRI
ncbi:DNA-directed DNA polymerase alpha subunit pol12 [Chytridiales sp. JEL 0842]|nr:DNA-directed DNA polymerase alpha subunit pol12 [Chytridiales sp. JEL 0842]